MINLVKRIRLNYKLSFVQIHIFVGLYIVTWHVSVLNLVVWLLIGIGSSLPIRSRSLLSYVHLTRSFVTFCIGRALPIPRIRVIRKFSRYTLEFDGLLFPCQFTGQIDWHALVQISAVRAWRTGLLGLVCDHLTSTHLVARPVGQETSRCQQTGKQRFLGKTRSRSVRRT